jgi:hypothetical protein
MEVNTDNIFNYIKGSLDHLIMAFSTNKHISKKEALDTEAGPLIIKELRERGYSVISVNELHDFNESLDRSKLNKQVIEIMNTYYETIKEIAGG